MKTEQFMITVALIAVTALTSSTLLAAQKETEAQLQAKAKITKAEAEKTALAKVPNGKIKSGELEKEHGKLVWSFDIARPRATGVTEIQVDAITGKIVSLKKETAVQEAREKTAKRAAR